MTKAAAAIPASTKKLFSTTVKYFMIPTVQNQNESRKEYRGKGGDSESSQFARLTFEQWLRFLLDCPEWLELQCGWVGTSLDFHKTKTALLRWQAAGFPRPKEPPEEWRFQVSAYTKKWVDSFVAARHISALFPKRQAEKISDRTATLD
jgi:hypothetical protein